MLDELKNIEYHGGKDGILFFICDVIGDRQITIHDAEVLCAHAPGRLSLSVMDLINYCRALGWINVADDTISTDPSISTFLKDKDYLNSHLISSTMDQLFAENIFSADMFFYDAIQCCYAFKNELLPLSLSCVRNVLISQGLLIPNRDSQGTRLYIASVYDVLIAKYCKSKRRQMSLEKLKNQLESNELAGEKAEAFVLSFEKERIGQPLCEHVKRISEIDVSAGYDIVSFNSCKSHEPDRFIEVKAVSSTGFFWSKNEYEIARLKGNLYYLYLVELDRINDVDYLPEIIQNPASTIMKSNTWFVEAQTYHVNHI
ncbi:MAG: DUF3883 domain-containing protein [Mogibacterium sp.]|nr:DUF3883 domain-containing protein [Mogibacterium sp.]